MKKQKQQFLTSLLSFTILGTNAYSILFHAWWAFYVGVFDAVIIGMYLATATLVALWENSASK